MDPEGQKSPKVLRDAYLNARLQTGMANPLDDAISATTGLDISAGQKIDAIPYDFVRKRLTIVVNEAQDESRPAPDAGATPLQSTAGEEGRPAGDGQPTSPPVVRPSVGATMITKGTLEGVLDVCTQVETPQGIVPLDAARHGAIEKLYADWSGQGYRVIGVATKPVSSIEAKYSRDDEKEMTFAGSLLFMDPPKPDVTAVLADLAHMGVQVKIITGDNQLVAQHAAQSVGLPVKGVVTGAQLMALPDEALWHLADRANLFAEVDPNQKERIILALKKTRHVVGYMGDGINDAPALHSADVGISVDTAVDVAKEAAEFVLLKQDLAVLRQGIAEGRRTFGNTLKYVFMATSANFGNMFSVAGASFFLPFLPMLPTQILLINFLTDLPEMTIAGDNVDQVYIETPHRMDIGFIRRFMLIFGPLSSVFDYLTFGLIYLYLHANEGLFHTGWFLESVLSATAVVFVLRTRLPFLRSVPSRAMLAVTAAVAVVTVLLPYTPLAGVLGFVPLPPVVFAGVAGIVVLYLLSAETAKHLFYRAEDRRNR